MGIDIHQKNLYNVTIIKYHHQVTKFFERRLIMLFAPKEKGQGLVEYALIIVLIAIVVIVAMQFLAPTIGNVFTNIGNTLSGT